MSFLVLLIADAIVYCFLLPLVIVAGGAWRLVTARRRR